jgi:hypothetical protein
MADDRRSNHPDLDQLAAFAAGELGAGEAEAVGRHLQDCVLCRLELRQMRRFESLEGDEKLQAEAEWSRARFALNRSYQDKIAPAVRRAETARPRHRGRIWWFVPAAAAAVVALVLIGQDPGPGPLSDGQPAGPVRGGETGGPAALSQVLVPISPAGELEGVPERFTWRADREFDAFTLEIFTPNLQTLFRQEGIQGTEFIVTDSLRRRLAPGQTYLWGVQGHEGLNLTAVSKQGWFTFHTH